VTCRFPFIPLENMLKKNEHLYILLSIILAAAVLAGALTACSNNQNTTEAIVKKYAAVPVKEDEITRLNEQMFATAKMRTDPSDYILGAGDLLEITVFESESLNTTTRVSSRGYVTLPLLGQIKVKELTAREAEVKIESLYRAKYIKDPHVSVFVEEHLSQRVTLVGQFKQPGTYEYPSKQSLLDVMALAGGLTDNSGHTVQVRRHSARPDEPNVLLVDLDELIKEGKADLNVEIRGGDIIFAPEAGHFFVDGAIRHPGSYPIKDNLVLREALLAAGGIAPWGLKDSLVLIRVAERKQRNVIEIDLNKPENQEMKIQPADVIVVKSSSWGKMVHGSGVWIGLPGVAGVGYKNPEQ
jgi:polysaccharide biosynthesis/export protein